MRQILVHYAGQEPDFEVKNVLDSRRLLGVGLTPEDAQADALRQMLAIANHGGGDAVYLFNPGSPWPNNVVIGGYETSATALIVTVVKA